MCEFALALGVTFLFRQFVRAVTRFADGGDDLGQRRFSKQVAHRGFLGGEIHAGGDAGELVQRIFNAGRTGGAGHPLQC